MMRIPARQVDPNQRLLQRRHVGPVLESRARAAQRDVEVARALGLVLGVLRSCKARFARCSWKIGAD